MIDCESEVYDRIMKEVRKEFPNIASSSEFINVPASFPFVHIEMVDNPVYRTFSGSFDDEQVTISMFEVNVYSNNPKGKKSEAKKIFQIIDKCFFDMNFNRTAYTPVPNLSDATIYRVVARYTGVTDGKYFYRR